MRERAPSWLRRHHHKSSQQMAFRTGQEQTGCSSEAPSTGQGSLMPTPSCVSPVDGSTPKLAWSCKFEVKMKRLIHRRAREESNPGVIFSIGPKFCSPALPGWRSRALDCSQASGYAALNVACVGLVFGGKLVIFTAYPTSLTQLCDCQELI